MIKIIGLLTALVIIIATLSVGTFAYFNDVTTVADNTITAGTLTLAVDGGSPVAINVSDITPLAEGSAGAWVLVAGGSINGDLQIDVSTITNNENTRADIETASGDLTDGATEGELGGLLLMAIWLDVNGDGNLDNGDVSMNATSGAPVVWAGGTIATPTYATAPSIFYTVDSFDSATFVDVKTNFTGAGGTARAQYYFPNSVTQTNQPYYDDNQAQSDGVSFDITFILNQS